MLLVETAPGERVDDVRVHEVGPANDVPVNDVPVNDVPAVVRPRTSVRESLPGLIRSFGPHGAWIAIWSAVGAFGTVLTPLLLTRPLALLILSPRTVVVVVAAAQLDLIPFLLVGLFRLSVADWSYFELGRRAGAVSELPSSLAGVRARVARFWPLRLIGRVSHRLAAMVCRSRPAAALVLALRPSGRYLAVAGAYGVSWGLAAASSVFGTVAYLVIVHQSLATVTG